MNNQDPLQGLRVDNYQIDHLIGQGGMASVYLATDVALKRDVVIKVLLPTLAENEQLRLRFEREAQATAQLHHQNIVQVYTTGTLPNGLPYIALQYIEGGSLSDHLGKLSREGQWLSTLYALSITRQMASALQVAHKANIVHRDLKPSNILLRKDGTPVLSDLGIAAVQQATMRLTQTGGVIGTPYYMSPEQASSQVIDGRSDIYSLGVILYELLSGRLPFDADSPLAILHKHIYEQPPSMAQVRPDLSPQTAQLVDTCLRKKPDNRYRDAESLIAALDGAIAAENANPLITKGLMLETVVEPIPSPIPGIGDDEQGSPPRRTEEAKNRKWWPYLVIVAILILLGIGAIFLVQKNRDQNVLGEADPPTNPTILVVTATSQPHQPSATFVPTVIVVEPTITIPPEPEEPPVEPEVQSYEVPVDARMERNDTGIFIQPGQTVSILYEEGQWQPGPSPTWPMVGPDGDFQVPSKVTFPVQNAPLASLIGGINGGEPFLVGRGTSFVANEEGNLWLAANDDGFDDNAGEMRVRVELGPLPDNPMPSVREGVEACEIHIGESVTAGPNTRLWNGPDAVSGQALDSIESGGSLRVLEGPLWGRIRRDIDASGWWWRVERPSDGFSGWLWQARLLECESP